MKFEYEFKRDIYYDIKDIIENSISNITFLLGPRKCGKTVCLKQIERNFENTQYTNFKLLNDKESRKKFDEINEAISKNQPIVYLLDEITYAFYPEKEIYQIADTFSEVENTNTKIVFTGSQSNALEIWANRAFSGNVNKIKADFLTYSEFLRYKNLSEISEKTYNQFLFEASEFYKFNSLEEYLRGCLEETIISNSKTSNYIMGNECYLLTENNIDTLIDICYQTLFTLHNQVNAQTFAKSNKIYDDISNYFRHICNQMEDNELADLIEKSFINKYNSFKSKPLDSLKQAYLFLYKCDLISITPVTGSITNIPNIFQSLYIPGGQINYKDELYKTFNICINYPMFYVRILQDILKDKMPETLPKMLLGSIVECHARGLLPKTGFEYRDIDSNEVDYVNLSEGVAIEFTVSNKTNKNVHFNCLPEELDKILLTKDIADDNNGVRKIPYYEFLYQLSHGSIKELAKIPLEKCDYDKNEKESLYEEDRSI